VEYGLLAVAIAALIAVVVTALGGVVQDTYTGACENLQERASTATTCD
jgi:Flp pilus assembly pilin Flp